VSGKAIKYIVRAGADVNLEDNSGDTPHEGAELDDDVLLKILPILFRAGAALPSPELMYIIFPAGTIYAYMQKLLHAGSFKRYEQNHLNAITATFVPKFLRLPPELVRRVVEYAFHVGDY
jgi:ankyrin repeat protein